MSQDFKQLFSHLSPNEPSENLYARIISRLDSQKRKMVFRKRAAAVFALFSMACSIVAIIPAWEQLNSNLTQTGFWQFLSLLASDYEIVMTSWQSFSLSLLESLPIISLVMFLGVLLVFMESLRLLLSDAKFILRPIHNN